MDGGLVLFLLVMAGVVVALAMLWKHRQGRIARGIGAAGAAYNEFNGQGRPPVIAPPGPAEDTRPDR